MGSTCLRLGLVVRSRKFWQLGVGRGSKPLLWALTMGATVGRRACLHELGCEDPQDPTVVILHFTAWEAKRWVCPGHSADPVGSQGRQGLPPSSRGFPQGGRSGPLPVPRAASGVERPGRVAAAPNRGQTRAGPLQTPPPTDCDRTGVRPLDRPPAAISTPCAGVGVQAGCPRLAQADIPPLP